MAQQWRLVLCVVLLALTVDVSAVTGRGGKTHKQVSSLKLQARTLQRKLLQHESAAQELRDAKNTLKGQLARATETLTQQGGSCDAQVDKLRADFADQMDQLDRLKEGAMAELQETDTKQKAEMTQQHSNAVADMEAAHEMILTKQREDLQREMDQLAHSLHSNAEEAQKDHENTLAERHAEWAAEKALIMEDHKKKVHDDDVAMNEAMRKHNEEKHDIEIKHQKKLDDAVAQHKKDDDDGADGKGSPNGSSHEEIVRATSPNGTSLSEGDRGDVVDTDPSINYIKEPKAPYEAP